MVVSSSDGTDGTDPGREPPLWRELIGGARDRFKHRWEIAKLARTGGWPLLGAALGVQVIAGVLPAAFVVATAETIAAVPAAVSAGTDSPQWLELRTSLIIAAVLFFGAQLLLPVQAFVGDLLRRRIDYRSRDRLMAASFAGGGVAVLEDAELLEQTSDAFTMTRVALWTPGAACAGLIALVSRYTQVVLMAGLVAVVFAWWAGVGLLVAGLTIRFGYRLGLSAFGQAFGALAAARRKAEYYRGLMAQPTAAKEVRIYGLLPWLQESYRDAATDSTRPLWRARRRIFYGPYVLYTLVSFVALALVLAGAARASATTALGIGAFMVVTQAALSAIRIGGFIAEADVQTEYGMLAHHALRKFERLTASAAETLPAPGSDEGQDPVREIRFEKVSFRYRPGGAAILEDLDLTIAVGASTAIVGLNGAGKTTLVKLLARLYEPTSGRILADGVDIRTYSVASWQRRVAAIFQDFVHFELPVRENVGFGAVELLDDRVAADVKIWEALRRAGAEDFVAALPGGLDTPLSRQYTGGTDLSGGQWQRVAIARALLAVEVGARILVLDEPTANLDVRAEVDFFDRFLDLTEGLTSLVISHRFSTVRRADRIVVLEHGRVLEQGTHAELLSRGGRYAQLFELQAARYADADPTVPDERIGV